jgi:hypothetical protein
MGPTNSYPGVCAEKPIYLELVCELYRDIAHCYGVTCRQRKAELRFIEARYYAEGVSFLTKQLPRLGKAVNKALSSGQPLNIVGFKTCDGVLPRFLGWLLKRVFDASGNELDNPDPLALKHFRQLVYIVYKLEIPYAPNTAKAVVDAFVATEVDLSQVDWDRVSSGWITQARDFISRVVSPLDPQGIKPKHGPGSVATGEKVCEKTIFKRIYSSLDEVYSFSEWFRLNLSHVAESWRDDQVNLEVIPEPTARVVLVPKDSRGPRLISCEPLEVQWIQQGLGSALQNQIETSKWTRGRINFRDQVTNRRLAIAGSLGQGWVTLDMKEASDRVSLKLVEKLFEGHPQLLAALIATRSTSTILPDGTVLPLKKYAPMGSSLCFPVESLCFYALAVSAIRLTGVPWRKALESVYVYGDDLVVRDQVYASLLLHFPTVGLMFNVDKCCTARFFRESCGCDAYVGVDVTPIKLKTVWPRRRTNSPDSLVSYVALSNALYGQGYIRAAEYVKLLVEDRYGVIPYTDRRVTSDNGSYVAQSGGVAWVSMGSAITLNVDRNVRYRYNTDLHRSEFLSYSSVPVKRKTNYDGYAEWLRRLSAGFPQGKEPHGGTYALVRRNRLKRTWMEV